MRAQLDYSTEINTQTEQSAALMCQCLRLLNLYKLL